MVPSLRDAPDRKKRIIGLIDHHVTRKEPFSNAGDELLMLVKLGVGHEGTIQPPAFAKRSHTFECRTWETIFIYI